MATSKQRAISTQRAAIPDGYTSPQAKLVYLSVSVAGKATVSELQHLLGMSKLTLLPILETLAANGHVRRTEDGYVCR